MHLTMAKILVVDDRDLERQYLATLFRHAGHEVEEAMNGIEALRVARTKTPDLVIADVVMPTMDGFEMLRQMREEDATRDTPVVLYTASYDEKITRTLAAECTGTTILGKPAEPGQVLAAVDRVLSNSSTRLHRLSDKFRDAHLEMVTNGLYQQISALERANAELQKSNEALRQFAYVAAHDLREPARQTALFAEIVATKYKGKQLDAEGEQLLDYCKLGAQRMSDLVSDLLKLAELASGRESLGEIAIADTNQVLQHTLQDLRSRIEESGALITYTELPNVLVPAAHVSQLFLNLISNAIKFRHPKRRPEIRVVAWSGRDQTHFSVQDNGLGIAPQYHARIFELFQRLHGQHYSGSGIGLTLCRRIVEQYGGRIWVESELDRGTTFHFTLPAAGNVSAA